MRGWHRENWRHSLAAKGVVTRKFSFVANSLKGPGKRHPIEYVWSEKHGRPISKLAYLNAMGVKRGTARELRKVGDTLGVDISPGRLPSRYDYPDLTGISAMPGSSFSEAVLPYGYSTADTSFTAQEENAGIPSYLYDALRERGMMEGISPGLVQEYLPPNEQQAQLVESGPVQAPAAPLYTSEETEKVIQEAKAKEAEAPQLVKTKEEIDKENEEELKRRLRDVEPVTTPFDIEEQRIGVAI